MHFREPSRESMTQAQGRGQVTGSCDHGHELMGSVTCRNFADKLSSYWLLKHSAHWS